MYSKEEYRQRFNDLKSVVKLSYFANEYGLPMTNLSRFMKDSSFDYYLSLDKLSSFYDFVITSLENIEIGLHNRHYTK